MKFMLCALVISSLCFKAHASPEMTDWYAPRVQVQHVNVFKPTSEFEEYLINKRHLSFTNYLYQSPDIIDNFFKIKKISSPQLQNYMDTLMINAVRILGSSEGENASKMVAFNRLLMSEIIGSPEYSSSNHFYNEELFCVIEECQPISYKYIKLENASSMRLLSNTTQYDSQFYFDLLRKELSLPEIEAIEEMEEMKKNQEIDDSDEMSE